MLPERVHVPASFFVTAVGFRTPSMVRTVDPDDMLPVKVALLRVTVLPLTRVTIVPGTIKFPLTVETLAVMPIVEPRASEVLPPV